MDVSEIADVMFGCPDCKDTVLLYCKPATDFPKGRGTCTCKGREWTLLSIQVSDSQSCASACTMKD